MAAANENRTNGRAAVDVYMNKIVGDEPRLVRTRDISETGLFMYKLLEPEAPGVEVVGLEMKLPNSEDVIWAVGHIVRAEQREDGEGVAVRFVRMAEADRKIIADFVAGESARASCAA